MDIRGKVYFFLGFLGVLVFPLLKTVSVFQDGVHTGWGGNEIESTFNLAVPIFFSSAITALILVFDSLWPSQCFLQFLVKKGSWLLCATSIFLILVLVVFRISKGLSFYAYAHGHSNPWTTWYSSPAHVVVLLTIQSTAMGIAISTNCFCLNLRAFGYWLASSNQNQSMTDKQKKAKRIAAFVCLLTIVIPALFIIGGIKLISTEGYTFLETIARFCFFQFSGILNIPEMMVALLCLASLATLLMRRKANPVALLSEFRYPRPVFMIAQLLWIAIVTGVFLWLHHGDIKLMLWWTAPLIICWTLFASIEKYASCKKGLPHDA